MRRFAPILCALLLVGCIHTLHSPDGTTEVTTFGASKVTVSSDGEVKTESKGLSEGFVSVLESIPEAVLRVIGSIGAGMANTTP